MLSLIPFFLLFVRSEGFLMRGTCTFGVLNPAFHLLKHTPVNMYKVADGGWSPELSVEADSSAVVYTASSIIGALLYHRYYIIYYIIIVSA